MQRTLRRLAGAVAATAAVTIPAVGTVAAYRSQADILTTEAEINGRLVSQVVQLNPELWRAEAHRLETLLSQRPRDRTPEIRSLHDLDGTTIAAWDDGMHGPFVTRASLVHDAGVPVAELRVQRSARPLMLRAAWLALLGTVLGAAAFAVMSTLPMRALRRAHEALVDAATNDALTGLPNRHHFARRLQAAIEHARPTRGSVTVLHLDLHRFKDVNDRLGHAGGDRVLAGVARAIEATTKGAALAGHGEGHPVSLGRLEGDKLAVLVAGIDEAGAYALAKELLAALARPIVADGGTVQLSGSAGIAQRTGDDTVDAAELIERAEMATTRAKAAGRNHVQFFDDELRRSTQARIDLDVDLHGALARGEFLLHYQPKAALRDGRVEGFEALLRWQRAGHGLVPPDRFIPVLEDTRLIHEVGAWVIETACAQLAAWDRQGLPALTMAVNLSAHQFRDPTLPAIVERALTTAGIAAHRLELELTESLLMDDSESSREVLNHLYDIGVRVAIDDFGTGHSSLAYLKRFRIDTLKIDRTFVRGLPGNADNRAICGAMVALAHQLDLLVVCEGVEDGEQLDFLRTIACDAVQGYHLARPMPAHDVVPWLQQRGAGAAAAVVNQAAAAASTAERSPA